LQVKTCPDSLGKSEISNLMSAGTSDYSRQNERIFILRGVFTAALTKETHTLLLDIPNINLS